jgi:hypothetical protein
MVWGATQCHNRRLRVLGGHIAGAQHRPTVARQPRQSHTSATSRPSSRRTRAHAAACIAPAAAGGGKPEVIFETDGRHSSLYAYEPPMSESAYVEPIDEVLDLGVDTISYVLGDCAVLLYDTKV